MKYEREQLEELCSHFNLLEYVEEDYEPVRKGNDYMIHCPCHVDKTASLSIKADGSSFYCHSCHRGGGAIQWFMKIEGMNFYDAVDKLKQLTGVDIRPTETASSFKFFKELKGITEHETKTVEREILSDDYLDRFAIPADGEPHEWLEEGITSDMIRKYNIRIDQIGNRIVYPVYDNEDRLIGAKGRTRFENYKLLGLTKYINFKKIGTTDFFQGMHENRKAIIDSGECIVVEGIKSVMKIDGFGYQNAVAAETSIINDDQAKILIKMGVKNCVLAFDQDVNETEAMKSANKLKRFMNVYLIIDRNGLLQSKQSPCDCGKGVWDQLYRERRKVV